MAKLAILSPFGEFHFGHELGLEPGDAAGLVAARRIGERRLVALALHKLTVNIAQRLARKTGAHLASVHELCVFVVVTQQQGSKMRPRAGGLRVAANNKLLAFGALGLQPRWRTGLLIRAVFLLGDDSFQALAA